jgi:hypothetical protein
LFQICESALTDQL